MMGLSAAIAVGILGLAVGLAGTGETYAAWNSSVTVPGGTIKTGNLDIALSNASHTSPAATLNVGSLATALGPGSTTRTAFTVNSTGSTAVAVGVTSSVAPSDANALTAAITAQVVPVTSATACTTTTATTPAALSSYSANLVHLAPQGSTGDSAILCLILTLSSSAPTTAQGLSANFTLTLTGVQAAS